jgi:hypothetical protein
MALNPEPIWSNCHFLGVIRGFFSSAGASNCHSGLCDATGLYCTRLCNDGLCPSDMTCTPVAGFGIAICRR